jgi:UDP-glucose:(heptosyl)LPS alpha-1,3-glucosyltransferase
VSIKVAIIIERVDVSLGGAERSIAELSCALEALGLDVTILAAQGDSDSDKVQILCNGRLCKRTAYAVFEQTLRHHLSHNRYDIIHSALPFSFAHVYQPRGGSYVETVIRSAASYENVWVTMLKRMTAWTNRRRQALVHAEAALCRAPDGPILAALSQYVVDQFQKHHQLKAQRIALIPNGVNTRRPVDQEAAKKLKAQINTELKLKDSQEAILFLFAAHNFRLKGLGPLLRAMAKVRQGKAECPCYLLIAGRGDTATYAHLAQSLGLAGRTMFIGAIDHIPNALSFVDVAVLPTFYDPASRFILEALAHNTPVITTRFNGAADLFIDRRHGRIIDSPTDISALSETLIHMSCPDTLTQMTTAINQDKLVVEVSINRAAGELIDLYKSILPRKGPNK